MIEVEIKVKIKNGDSVKKTIEQLGFCEGKLLRERDLYFDNVEKDFRERDRALRIRQCEDLTYGETRSFITYKGPKLDQISMTRKELETEMKEAEIVVEILKNLGYEPVQPVVKLRQYFHRGQMTLCLDQVEDLGDYLEMETLVEKEEKREEALEDLLLLLEELGYQREEIIRSSYLSMLQKEYSGNKL